MRRCLTLVVVLLAASCEAYWRPRYGKLAKQYEAQYASNAGEKWFNQIVDHTDSHSSETFPQRYYTVLDNWKAPNGPFILYIGGEGPQNSAGGVRDEAAALAKLLGAGVLTLEHRFFGKSLPRPDLSTKYLSLLTVEQELDDLAYFARSVQAEINAKYNKTTRNKFIALGGSYAGSIASHVRFAHPEVFDAAWSSSGVVKAVLDFSDYDMQATLSVGQKCAEVIRRATEAIEALLLTDNDGVKKLFEATMLRDDDFMSLIADGVASPIQYSEYEQLCTPMEAAYDAQQDLVEAFSSYCKNYFYPMFLGEDGPAMYLDSTLQNVDPNAPYASSRAWTWMVCNQLSYSQTYPGHMGIRSAQLDLIYQKRKCDAAFGPGVWPPNVEAFNKKYGGDNPKATNVFYLNGSQDPWQWAGVRRTVSPTQKAHVMIGKNIGHCKDLSGTTSRDPQDLVAGRKMAESFIVSIINA